MQSLEQQALILVSSYDAVMADSYSLPYLEVVNSSNLENFPKIHNAFMLRYLSNMRSSVHCWGEIAALVAAKNMMADIDIVGLQHYRRFLILDQDYPESHVMNFSVKIKKNFLELQANHLWEYGNSVAIPRGIIAPTNLFDIFANSHGPLVEVLIQSAKIFDAQLSRYFQAPDTIEYLKSSNVFFGFNMFIGPRDFYFEWLNILHPVLSYLDALSFQLPEQGYQSRWGGFIAERFFSYYIQLCINSGHWDMRERTVAFFL